MCSRLLPFSTNQKGTSNGYRCIAFNPLTAGAAYIRVFIFLLAHQVPHFKYVKDKMWHQPARFEKS